MLDFTHEVFHCLANKIHEHIRVVLEYTMVAFINIYASVKFIIIFFNPVIWIRSLDKCESHFRGCLINLY